PDGAGRRDHAADAPAPDARCELQPGGGLRARGERGGVGVGRGPGAVVGGGGRAVRGGGRCGRSERRGGGRRGVGRAVAGGRGLDPRSMRDASSSPAGCSGRAANAAVCAYAEDPAQWYAAEPALFEEQPDAARLSDEELAGLVSDATGLDVADCVAEGTYLPW